MKFIVYASTVGLTPVIDRYTLVSDDTEVTPVPVVSDIGRGFYSFDATPDEPIDVRIDFGNDVKASQVISENGINAWSVFNPDPAECITAKITKNLVESLDGKTITYYDRQNVISAEQQRSIYDPDGKSPFVEVCGPWPETVARGNLSNELDLHYHIELHENTINDKQPAPPITKTVENVGADLIKIIMADIRRGGSAIMTTWEDTGFYFCGSSECPELVIYVDITVKAFVNTNDPYLIGA
jgi:hypothetical protein